MAVRIGNSFLLRTGNSTDKSAHHLCVVITDSPDSGGRILYVSLSSIKDYGTYDTSCVFRVGDHDWLTKDSFVDYSVIAQKTPDEVLRQATSPKTPFSPEQIAKIRFGLLKSHRTGRWAKSELRSAIRREQQRDKPQD